MVLRSGKSRQTPVCKPISGLCLRPAFSWPSGLNKAHGQTQAQEAEAEYLLTGDVYLTVQRGKPTGIGGICGCFCSLPEGPFNYPYYNDA